LPFQSETGIHTSIWIVESLVGVRVPATRQYGATPAGSVFANEADVIFVLGRFRVARLSQVAPGKGDRHAIADKIVRRVSGRTRNTISEAREAETPYYHSGQSIILDIV
jgi:hypothetical protein